ncbi:DinB family protein [Sinomicrobium weinanense]|uniref:DinB family protein n=1 Tax=Sinomicrobium weinanense TaxID=2842200 RepID=A0A926JNJ0_9FLAO|nr:DinB family protein [Sinomicrobium weinanense]MBC9794391.1 DinB family protein [Sinomicrobium weinanense]MBU3124298.1 DinB family protein [Sinomicrobium weinanense]
MSDKQFDILESTRNLVINAIEGLSLEQINKIPEGFNNNIAWNFAHLVVSQQILCYKLSGLPCNVDQGTMDRFKKGTAPDPERPMTIEELNGFREKFLGNVVKFREDYEKGLFKEFHTYTTSMNVTLADIHSAIAYNNMHEGLHLGYILALKRAIG